MTNNNYEPYSLASILLFSLGQLNVAWSTKPDQYDSNLCNKPFTGITADLGIGTFRLMRRITIDIHSDVATADLFETIFYYFVLLNS
ncbi:MAG: hypothetical protein WAM14_22240 [Candidatus Nitrosopolaris sp.]